VQLADLEFEITKLSLVPGDVVIAKTSEAVPIDLLDELRTAVAAVVPERVKVLVVAGDILTGRMDDEQRRSIIEYLSQ
jgi:uncharacterized protein with ACT and thioredoxin-like domain